MNVPAVRRLVRQMAWPGAPGSAAIPLATGRLTVRKEDPAFASRQRVLEAEAGRLGTTIDALALAAALAQPWADVVLSGAVTGEQLASNLGALAVGIDEVAEERLLTLEEPAEEYWSRRGELAWN